MIPLALLLLVPSADARPRPVGEEVRPDFSDPAVRAEAQLAVLSGLVDGELYEQALTTARDLRAQGLDHWRLDRLQAEALAGTGMASEAVALAETAARKAPREADAWATLGVLYADVKRLEEATDALERASRLRRDDPGILNNLGWVWLARGQAERAADQFRASLTFDPTSAQTRNNLGFALARLDRYDEALEMFRSAGTEAEARYNLGVACELRQDRAGALTNYQAAVSANPDFPKARSALDRMLSTETPK